MIIYEYIGKQIKQHYKLSDALRSIKLSLQKKFLRNIYLSEKIFFIKIHMGFQSYILLY